MFLTILFTLNTKMNAEDLGNIGIKNILLAGALVGGSMLIGIVLGYIFVGF